MTNGQKIVDFALTFAGKKDDAQFREWFYGPPRPGVSAEVTKYNNWLELMKKAPDCAVAVSFWYDHSGFPLGKGDYIHGYASVPNILLHYRATGEIIKDPRPGCMVIMGWNGITPMHIGLFIKRNADGSDHTVEANTSNPLAAIKSEDNGGWTMEKDRPKKFILAYIWPKILDNAIS